jgi:uncharacterized protein YwlG (UPF0340 family)
MEIRAAWERLQEMIARSNGIPYAIANQNCEHVARYIVSERTTSTQVFGVALAAIIGISILALRDAA